jgi:hypothetical protein
MPTPASTIREYEVQILCKNEDCPNFNKPTNLKRMWEFPRETQYKLGGAFDYEPNFNAILTECCGSGEYRRERYERRRLP